MKKLKTIIISLGIIGLVLGGLYLTQSEPQKVSESVLDNSNCSTIRNATLRNCSIGWVCGDTITFTYRGSSVTYGTVSRNGECWMDRNLGAIQQAGASNDYLAYGDLFQWGRDDDGHQTIVWTSSSGSDGAEQSRETSTNSSGDAPGHDDFILEPDNPYDWRVPKNDNLWQGASGINNPCPSGWRIPTEAELNTERLSWGSNNSAGAYGSTLRFVVPGYRNHNIGSLNNVGSNGYYWSSTIDGMYARNLGFYSTGVYMYTNGRAHGFSVRCLKD